MTFKILLVFSLILAAGCNAAGQKAISKTKPLAVGAIGPDFTLSGNSLEKVTLSKLNKTTVLVFYRGYW